MSRKAVAVALSLAAAIGLYFAWRPIRAVLMDCESIKDAATCGARGCVSIQASVGAPDAALGEMGSPAYAFSRCASPADRAAP